MLEIIKDHNYLPSNYDSFSHDQLIIGNSGIYLNDAATSATYSLSTIVSDNNGSNSEEPSEPTSTVSLPYITVGNGGDITKELFIEYSQDVSKVPANLRNRPAKLISNLVVDTEVDVSYLSELDLNTFTLTVQGNTGLVIVANVIRGGSITSGSSKLYINANRICGVTAVGQVDIYSVSSCEVSDCVGISSGQFSGEITKIHNSSFDRLIVSSSQVTLLSNSIINSELQVSAKYPAIITNNYIAAPIAFVDDATAPQVISNNIINNTTDSVTYTKSS